MTVIFFFLLPHPPKIYIILYEPDLNIYSNFRTAAIEVTEEVKSPER